MRKAYIGDIHGALPELEKLWHMLQHHSLDAIEHLGDLVDRGPDSGGVIQFCREHNMDGVIGNHDSVILEYCTGGSRHPKIPKNPDKARTLESISKDPANIKYLQGLPLYKIQESGDQKLLQVHAGVSPYLPLEQQGLLCCTASLVNPKEPHKTRWMGIDRKGRPEEENRKEGWVRWYEYYCLEYDLVFGHKTHQDLEGCAWKYPAFNDKFLYGVDTGAWWSKNLTALIWPDALFVSTTLGEYRL